MNNFFKAVYAHGTGENDFNAAIDGRFYYGRAKQGCSAPYAVFFGLPASNEDTFSETIDDLSFQINIYSKNKAATEAGEILRFCKNLFDGAVLEVEDYRDVTIQREMQVPPWLNGNKWCASIEFNVLIQED